MVASLRTASPVILSGKTRIKGYSYKYRLYAVQLLAQKHLNQSVALAQVAIYLDKSI